MKSVSLLGLFRYRNNGAGNNLSSLEQFQKIFSPSFYNEKKRLERGCPGKRFMSTMS